jgi:superfamily I DNA/RNA helicase
MKDATESLRLTDSVAILLPSHSKILSFTDKVLVDADKPIWKRTYDEHGNMDYNYLNDHLEANGIPMRYVGNGFGNFLYDQPMITLMTYHGSKGLDFDKVFLPFCNHRDDETTQVDNDKKVFLVGMTRSRGDLIISFSKKLNRFVAKFAESCTHKDLESDEQPTLFVHQVKQPTKVKSCTMNELFGW